VAIGTVWGRKYFKEYEVVGTGKSWLHSVLPIEIEVSNPEIPPSSRIASRRGVRGDAIHCST
jgi:hypothetical protein